MRCTYIFDLFAYFWESWMWLDRKWWWGREAIHEFLIREFYWFYCILVFSILAYNNILYNVILYYIISYYYIILSYHCASYIICGHLSHGEQLVMAKRRGSKCPWAPSFNGASHQLRFYSSRTFVPILNRLFSSIATLAGAFTPWMEACWSSILALRSIDWFEWTKPRRSSNVRFSIRSASTAFRPKELPARHSVATAMHRGSIAWP